MPIFALSLMNRSYDTDVLFTDKFACLPLSGRFLFHLSTDDQGEGRRAKPMAYTAPCRCPCRPGKHLPVMLGCGVEIAVCAFPFGKCNVPHCLQKIPEKKLRSFGLLYQISRYNAIPALTAPTQKQVARGGVLLSSPLAHPRGTGLAKLSRMPCIVSRSSGGSPGRRARSRAS